MLRDLAVIDPGLMDASGHHAGFATVLAEALTQGKLGSANVFCHESLDPLVLATLETAGVAAEPVFTVNFYQHFDDGSNAAGASLLINQLCCEYISVFRKMKAAGSHPTLLYPCLSWEHATALAMAIEYEREYSTDWRHIGFAMFSPGVDHRGVLLDRLARMNFHFGFCALSELDCVELYASDYEARESYARLLNKAEVLQLHPCYLADWSVPPVSQKLSADRRILLYVGDAKINKGFTRLPGFIEKNLHLLSANDRFVVHYTHKWANAAIETTIDQLQAIAEIESRLEIHEGFWDSDTMMSQLCGADLFVLLYDQDTYQHKSSGFIWLTAWLGTPIAVAGNSWLSREAHRLGQRSIQIKDYCLEPVLAWLDSISADDDASNPGDRAYREKLYEPFWQWIGQTVGARGMG